MLDVEIKTTEFQTVAFLPMHGAYAQIPEAFARLYGWIARHGLRASGMPSSVYLTDPATVPESAAAWEVRAPVEGNPAEAEPDASGVGIKRVAPNLVAAAMYRGPYEKIGPAYGEIAAWIPAHGYHVNGPPEEIYFSEPSTPPEDTLTEIEFPVARN